LAELLGAKSGAKVSRYESFSRVPSAGTIFAYEVIFGRFSEELFAGTHDAVRRAVRARARKLSLRLERQPAHARIARKLALLRTIVESKPRARRN
jgi:hypothetical protein